MRTIMDRHCIGSVPCSGAYGRPATRGAGATPRKLRRVAATTQTVDPVEHLQGKDLESWETCRKVLEEQWGLTDQEAQKTLVRAFGWGKQNYWRNEKVEEVPTLQQLESVQGFMEGLGIPKDDFITLVKKFPELVGHSVEERLLPNAKELETSWFMKGKILAATVKRRPQVLGFNMNCEGNCKGECTRCWVQF